MPWPETRYQVKVLYLGDNPGALGGKWAGHPCRKQGLNPPRNTEGQCRAGTAEKRQLLSINDWGPLGGSTDSGHFLHGLCTGRKEPQAEESRCWQLWVWLLALKWESEIEIWDSGSWGLGGHTAFTALRWLTSFLKATHLLPAARLKSQVFACLNNLRELMGV